MNRKIAATLAAALALGACTSLETRPTYAVSSPERAFKGHSYALPMLQYEVVVGYKLVSCPGSKDAQGKPTSLAFKVETVAASDHVAGERYTIDYSALSSIFKVTDFSIEEYQRTGTLKAMNASAEDKTGDVIKSAVELGISGASLLAPPIAALGVAHAATDDGGVTKAIEALLNEGTLTRRLECTDTALQALADADKARADIKALNPAIAKETRAIDAITIRANIKLSDPNDGADLIAIHGRQLIRLDQLADAQDRLATAEKKLIMVETRTWPTDPYQTSGTFGLTPAMLVWLTDHVTVRTVKVGEAIYDVPLIRRRFAEVSKPWTEVRQAEGKKKLDAVLNGVSPDAVDGACRDDDLTKCIAARLDVHGELLTDRDTPLPDCAGKPETFTAPCRSDTGAISARANVAHKGVFYRQPGRARLLLCDKSRSCRNGDREPLLRTGWDTAPQLGQLRFAPLTNGPFQNNALSIALREDGTLIKLQYSEKSAILAQALAAASSAVTKLDEEKDERAKERRQAILDRRADIAYERTETAAIRAEGAAVRTDEIAQLQYEIDKIQKNKTLLTERFPPAKPGSVVDIEFSNETIRLEAIAAQLRARLAVLEAQEALAKK